MSILAIDLDGFITEKDHGYSPNYWERCTVNTKVVELMKKAREQGHMIKIFTSRLESECAVETIQMLKNQNVPYDLIYFNKPFYDRYFGDKYGSVEDLEKILNGEK